ncbi:31094_t:CDS:2 [Gigaspora margarita]|uniref:31094_t:CDS:1 n=1 Tax=Gigaspora margarita TaxID=4874 RepID=A0ABN7V0K6_GIGMA|nr:31094_t:CDS:2 [Gigaspora margarita]
MSGPRCDTSTRKRSTKPKSMLTECLEEINLSEGLFHSNYTLKVTMMLLEPNKEVLEKIETKKPDKKVKLVKKGNKEQNKKKEKKINGLLQKKNQATTERIIPSISIPTTYQK